MYMYVQFEYSNSVYTCRIAPSLDPNDFILVHIYIHIQLLYLIRDRANICKLVHMPAQSGNTQVLTRMRRG